MKKKLLSLIFMLGITASLAALPLTAQAETISNKTFTNSTELVGGNTYYGITIQGGTEENPIVITVPEGEEVFADLSRTSITFTVADGSYVIFTGGGTITVQGSNTYYGLLSIPGKSGSAHVVLENITLKGEEGEWPYVIEVGNLSSSSSSSYILDIKDNTVITGFTMSASGSKPIIRNYGTVNMSGGKIYGNTATSVIDCYASYTSSFAAAFNMSGGELYNNTLKGSSYGVVAISQYTTFNMSGGKIYNNNVGQAVVTYDNCVGGTISGGAVYNNATASNFAHVNTDFKFDMKGGLWLDDVDLAGYVVTKYKTYANYGKADYPMYRGKISGLPTDATIKDETDNLEAVRTSENSNNTYLIANKDHTITAVDSNGASYIGEYKPALVSWSFALDPTSPQFATTADAGYYSDEKTSEDKDGIIAFNSMFTNFGTCMDNVTEYGIYIYSSGVDEKVTLKAGTLDELEAKAGKFYATADGIPKTNFDTPVVAMPYAVKDGNIVTGSPFVYTVNQAGKWLGSKPVEE